MFFGRLTTAPIATLRTRATLLAPVQTPDEIGGVTRSFSPLALLWCRIEPVLGEDRFRDGRHEQVVSHRITIRWHDAVAAGVRLAVGERLFVVTASADPDGRRRRLILLADEVAP